MFDDPSVFERALARRLKARAGDDTERDGFAVAERAISAADQDHHSGVAGIAFVAVVVVAALAVSASFISRPLPSTQTSGASTAASDGPTVRVDDVAAMGGVRFELPPGWRLFPFDEPFSTSGLVGYISMVEVRNPCARTISGDSCDRTPYTLTSDTAVVAVETASGPASDPTADGAIDAEVATIDGMPALRQVSSPVEEGVDRVVTWMIAMPGTVRNYYRLTAAIRGPSEGELTDAVDRIVADMTFETPVVPLATDEVSRVDAARVALDQLERDSAAYACVPREAGVEQEASIGGLPMTSAWDTPATVRCSYEIEPTSRQLWKMTVRFVWDDAEHLAGGSLDITAWLNAGGSVVGTKAAFGP